MYNVTKIAIIYNAGRLAPGTPAYKSPEEYYEEVLTCKKVFVILELQKLNTIEDVLYLCNI